MYYMYQLNRLWQGMKDEVVKFYNLYNSKKSLDQTLNAYAPYQVYPSFEGDLALVQNGSDSAFILPYTTYHIKVASE